MIALDMDGTVLNKEKKIDTRTAAAIHRALAAGKEVVFCTGRSLAEMEEILKDYPDMNYLCGASGGLLYDLKKQEPIKLFSISSEGIQGLKELVDGRDIMIHAMSEGKCLVNQAQLPKMEHYQMGIYQEMFRQVCNTVEDVFKTLENTGCNVEKLNLFHTSVEEREISRKYAEEKGLPLTMVDSEIASLEFSPKGLSKAVGLQALCEKLAIPMEEVIMVGDADNDIEALKAAGLAVAMGNANERVKAVSQVQVADNDHCGCAEAIERFFFHRKDLGELTCESEDISMK